MAANGVQAQSDSESEPGGAAIREGWVLVSGAEPPFSLALPPGWSQGAAADDSLAVATSEAGPSLVLASGESPVEADFDAYVTSVEKRLEKQRKGDVPTVLRMAPTGLVARLELAPGKRQEASEHSALFLFPACEDGHRSLTVSGDPPLSPAGGAPDEWDLIASAVNPCSADPAPQGTEYSGPRRAGRGVLRPGHGGEPHDRPDHPQAGRGWRRLPLDEERRAARRGVRGGICPAPGTALDSRDSAAR